jgi:hypothetical protein
VPWGMVCRLKQEDGGGPGGGTGRGAMKWN